MIWMDTFQALKHLGMPQLLCCQYIGGIKWSYNIKGGIVTGLSVRSSVQAVIQSGH